MKDLVASSSEFADCKQPLPLPLPFQAVGETTVAFRFIRARHLVFTTPTLRLMLMLVI